MNGIHDLGGMHGLGPVPKDGGSNPPFAEEWHGRLFAVFLSLFVGGYFSFDEFRYEVEQIDPVVYLEAGYFDKWLIALEAILERRGVIAPGELDAKVCITRSQQSSPC